MNQIEMAQDRMEKTVEMFTDTARKAFLAGLGFAALAQDELEQLVENAGDFADKLVERGEKLDKRSRERVERLMQERRDQVKDQTGKAEKRLTEVSGELLNRFNVPTATDIEDLNKKVAALSRKVDRLRKEQEAAPVA